LSRQKQGKAIPSFLSEHLQKLGPEDAAGRDMLKRVAASLYGGGTDTVASANSSFFLLMSLHPEVQQKAQEEIDSVVGHDRLPNAQDRKDLPYVAAIMREVMRLNPVVPLGESQREVPLRLLTCALGLPHRLKEDDVYEGIFLSEVVINMIQY
jgi:cytochrome P450